MSRNKIGCVFFISLVALLSGCSKSILDTTPYSFDVLTTYKSAQDAELALTGCYNVLNAQSVQGQGALGGFGAAFAWAMPTMLSAGTDELVPNRTYANVDFAPFGLLGFSSQSQPIRYNWFFLYAGINRTNYLIAGIDAVAMDTARKRAIAGEAHFLRGLYYMYIGMLYGAAPLMTDPLGNLKVGRDSVSKIFNQVISDFQFAYANLPARADIAGRANKWSAAGFLAKVYTYLASCKRNNVGKSLNFPLNGFDWVDDNQMYRNALNITNDIITGSGYILIPNYNYLFRETTTSSQLQESLFSVLSSSNAAGGNYNCWLQFMLPTGNTNLFGGGYGYFRPVGEMYTKYNAVDKRLAQNVTFSVTQASPKEVIGGVTYYVPAPATSAANGLLCVGKWREEDPVSNAKSILLIQSMGANTLLRYADILLLNAEAKYFTGDEPGARAMLSAVRQRSVANSTDLATLTAAYLKPDFVDELIDERSRELCFEGWRRIDLVRFNRLKQAINGLSTTLGYYNIAVTTMQQNLALPGGDGKIWFPIPATDIDLNPLLAQNPGF
jgi:hypothetical protein